MAVRQSAKKVKVSSGFDDKFNRVHTGIFQVITDVDDGPITALNAIGIPTWGTSFVWNADIDLWAFAQTYKADPIERIVYGGRDCWKWQVTVTWSSKSTERAKTSPRLNPIDDPPVISGSFLGERVTAIRDKDGNPIVNAAAEPYLDSPPTVLGNTDTLRISYHTAQIDLAQRAQYVGAVNQSTIWGLQPRQALLTRWDYSVKYAGDLEYIAHSFEFHIKFDETPASNVCKGEGLADKPGWYTILPNRGYSPYKIADDYNSKTLKRDGEDNPVTTPVSLLCNGTENTDPATEYWNVFAVEKERDFTAIPGMPNPLPGPFA